MSLIQINHLNFTYDGAHVPVFEDLCFRLDTSWKLGVVGRNGRGKTTLLRLLEGELEYTGQITCRVACRRFPCPVRDGSAPTAQVLRETAPKVEQWWLLRELSLLGLGEEVLERPFSTLSGGEQSRVLLAALFLDDGVWPMLDEPTDHLDAAAREQVAQYLRRSERGFLLVSHDRAFLDQCADHILALNKTGPEIIQGDFSTWYREKQAWDSRDQAQNEQLKGEIRHLKEAAQRTSAWSEQVESTKYGTRNSGLRPDRGFIGHKAAKMMKRSKAIEQRRQKSVEEKSRLLQDLERADSLKLLPAAHHSQRLLELKDVRVDFGRGPVCTEIGFTVGQGDRLCLDGGNGSGKTSLLRLILGEPVPHTGAVWRAPGLKLSYVWQKVDYLRGSLREFPICEGIDATQFMTVLRKLDFPREAFDADMSTLSTGQKKKVLLAASLCCSAHLYIWDEPLNFVDLFSRMQLEELILHARPTLLFVEHDQTFRERVATQTVHLTREATEIK